MEKSGLVMEGRGVKRNPTGAPPDKYTKKKS